MDKKTAQQAAQFLSTEHFTLQGARNGVISETNGRVNGFLTTISGSLVALAFVAQISDTGETFLYFSLVLFPVLFYLGLTTLVRVTQLALVDLRYIQAINRIRRFYVDIIPETAQYLTLSHYDDMKGIMDSFMHYFPSGPWQRLFSSAGQIAVILSLIVGVFSAILSASFFEVSTAVVILISAAGGLLTFAIYWRYTFKVSKLVLKDKDFRFPSPTE